MSVPAPTTWPALADTLFVIANTLTPSVASVIVRRFIDVAVELCADNEPFDPRALSDMLRFSTGEGAPS